MKLSAAMFCALAVLVMATQHASGKPHQKSRSKLEQGSQKIYSEEFSSRPRDVTEDDNHLTQETKQHLDKPDKLGKENSEDLTNVNTEHVDNIKYKRDIDEYKMVCIIYPCTQREIEEFEMRLNNATEHSGCINGAKQMAIVPINNCNDQPRKL